jgi:S-adenosylmethionine:tRNA ribosyltransferase-isomerase
MYQLDDFNFELPPERIAQHPVSPRTASRMLVVDDNQLKDDVFLHFIEYVRPDDVVVFNNTRVMAARLYGQKPSGGKVELLIERMLSDFECLALVKSSKPLKTGSHIILGGKHEIQVTGRQQQFYQLKFRGQTISDAMHRYGHIPLPPYIARPDTIPDQQNYQTVYADKLGAVAAPTAGLHFDDTMLARIRQHCNVAEVTLHVGSGTFQPVRVDDIRKHQMHHEWFSISDTTATTINHARKSGGRVIAVGTTSLRALESAVDERGNLIATESDTDIFITPGFSFQIVDGLLTNFHLPRSTLLMLVSAFAGYARIRHAYQHAVEQHYRFFSYGDAMLLKRVTSDNTP